MSMRHRLTALTAVVLLVSCGGGGGGNGGGNTADPVDTALTTGDPSGLSPSQSATLLQRATALATTLDTRQRALLASLHGNGLDQSLDVTTNSISIDPMNAAQATAFIRADNGAGIAAVSERGTGRALAYGANVLDWMGGTTRQPQHAALFKRAFAWTVTGDANATLPSTLRFAVAGYSAASVKAWVTKAGATPQEVTCAIATDNTCTKDLDLLVFGAGVAADAGLKARVAAYLDAGKAVIYLHPSWVNADGGRQVLAGMGMRMGGYPGNYFAPAAGVSVAAGRTAAQSIARGATLGPLVDTLGLLAKDSPSVDLATTTAPTDAVTAVHNDLAAFHANGTNLFDEPGAELYRLLVLWADLVRPAATDTPAAGAK